MAEPERKKILNPESYDWIWMITCSLCLFVDPLFFYTAVIDHHNKCLEYKGILMCVLCVIRSVLDVVYLYCKIVSLKILPEHVKTRKCLIRIIYRFFILLPELMVVFPLAQLTAFGFIPPIFGTAPDLMWPIFVHYYWRLKKRSLIGKDLKSSTTLLPITWWSAATGSLYYCMVASHVVGASWYMLSIDSELRCWRKELKINAFCDHDFLNLSCRYVNATTASRLNSSCSFVGPNEENFDYGIFIGALTSHVLESSTSFFTKLSFCFWWGLRNISSLGQNLETSTFFGEIIFAILISITGLVLFTLLLGNIQNHHQSIRKKRKEIEIESYIINKWISRQNLPNYLKKRIKQHEHYKWQENKFVNEEIVLHKLPKDIRRDVKRHLCLALLTKVPQFKTSMDSYLLDALCDRLKPVFYIKKTCILCEGEPIEEMIFIKQGNLETMAKSGSNLKDGDFFGEELVTWALDPNSLSHILPISTKTVKTISDVEAYTLMADDLKFIAAQLHARLHDEKLRTLGARKIQKAWLHYKERKMKQSLLVLEARPKSALDMAVGTSSLDLTFYALRFVTNALRSLRQKRESSNRLPQ